MDHEASVTISGPWWFQTAVILLLIYGAVKLLF